MNKHICSKCGKLVWVYKYGPAIPITNCKCGVN
jgi:hypothetical protein